MLTVVPLFFTFLPIMSVCFVVNIIEFDATVIQVRSLASSKTSFGQYFLHKKISVPSQEYDSCLTFVLVCLSFWFLPLDSGLSVLNFTRSSVFLQRKKYMQYYLGVLHLHSSLSINPEQKEWNASISNLPLILTSVTTT